jgi:SAM-dependent methyltransferase
MNNNLITSHPSNQNIIDLFKDEWSSKIPIHINAVSTPGHADLFTDPRIIWAWEKLGPFKDKAILELGPLEGAHTYILESLGAKKVTSVEANTNAFLKCLCIKEIFNLKNSEFKLGNFIPYLKKCDQYDLIVASGVLYHMADPLEFLNLITSKSNKIFIWTHYYNKDIINQRSDKNLFAEPTDLNKIGLIASKRAYPIEALSWAGFSGGKDSYAYWIVKDSLLKYFEDRGYSISTSFDQVDHPNGPAIAICATKQ